MLAAEHRQEEHTLDIELGRGFVAFPRGLTDWEWYTEPNTARLYFHLPLTANWSRKQWQGITIQPGQLVTSWAHLSRQLDMTENQVRSALKHLVSTGDIAIKTGSKYSMITLNHYLELTALNQRSHRQATSRSPQLYHQYHHNQKYHQHLLRRRRRRQSLFLRKKGSRRAACAHRREPQHRQCPGGAGGTGR